MNRQPGPGERAGDLRQVYPAPGPPFSYRVETQGDGLTVHLGGQEMQFALAQLDEGEGWCRTANGQRHQVAIAWVGPELHLWLDGELFVFRRPDEQRARRRDAAGGSDVLAPMPGTVLEVLVQPGDTVERGQTVMVMESMKMELVITAPSSGVVKRIPVEPGSQVDRGMRLLELESPSPPTPLPEGGLPQKSF